LLIIEYSCKTPNHLLSFKGKNLCLFAYRISVYTGYEIKYFLNLNEYYLPIFILSIHLKTNSIFLNHQRHSE
jgi:hypothetical protein